jgi:type IV secretory pathway VirB4 component
MSFPFFMGRPEYREPSYRLPELVPYFGFIAEGVILQKDAILQTTYTFRGHDLASSDRGHLVQACANLNNALRRFGTGWTLFVETQRRQCEPPPSGKFPTAAAFILDCERRRGSERTGPQFESVHYLTFTYRLPHELVNAAKGFFYQRVGGKESPNLAVDRAIAHFQRTCAELADLLLGRVFVAIRALTDPETCTYLHSCLSTNRHPVVPPQGGYYLDHILPDMPFLPAEKPMLGDSFLAIGVVSHFPPNTHPAILAQADALGFPYRLMTRITLLSDPDAEKDISTARRTFWAGRKTILKLFKEEATKEESPLLNNSAASRAADADSALQALAEGHVSFARTTITLVTWHANLAVAEQQMRELKGVFESHGCVVQEEGLNSKGAWLGSLPGHVYANVRRPILSTLNVAHLMPISSRWTGSQFNQQLAKRTGVAQSLLYAIDDSGGPCRFNPTPEGDDTGHMLNAGPIGAGKSVLLGNKAFGWTRYPDARVLIFDKDRSARAATLAMGGQILEPGNPDAPQALQPLARIDEGAEFLFATEFVLDLMQRQLHTPATPDRRATVDRSLRALARRARSQRTILNLGDASGCPEMRKALRPYTLQGPYGQIFDGDSEPIGGFGPWTMVELGHLLALGSAALEPAIDLLFHMVSRSLDGAPTLLQVDECHRVFDNENARKRLTLLIREARKNSLYCDMYSTSLADFANCAAAPILIESCPTKIFLPNPEACAPHIKPIYKGFGLDDAKIARIAQARRKQDYFAVNSDGCMLFNLALGPIGRAFTAMTSKQDQLILDEIVATTPPEEYGEAILRSQGLEWAAQLFHEARQRPGALFS